MRLISSCVAAAVALGVAWPVSAATVSSTFDANVDGWRIADIASTSAPSPDSSNPPTWTGSGGDSGGYIYTADTQNITGFLAPSKFTGNLSSFLGGVLSFDFQDTLGTEGETYSTVVLYTGIGAITYAGGIPGTTWTPFSIQLSASGWTFYGGGGLSNGSALTAQQFANALANVQYLAIDADWRTGADNSGLDTVVLTSAASTAPEPSTWALMATGFAALGFAVRRGARRRLALEA